jgi:hypothetical protein
MAVSVKSKAPKVPSVAIAVRTVAPVGIERTTDFHKADQSKPYDCIEVDGIAIYRVFRKGKVVGEYPAPTVISIRPTNRKFRTGKVVFVRRIERVGGAAKKS